MMLSLLSLLLLVLVCIMITMEYHTYNMLASFLNDKAMDG